MDTPEPIVNKNPHTNLLVLGAVVLMLALTGFVFWLRQPQISNQSASSTKSMTPPVVTTIPTTGSIKLATVNNTNRFSKAENIVVQLVVDSNKLAIVGLDALLVFDKSALTLEKTTSLLPDFKVYSNPKSTHTSVTITKSVASKTKEPLVNQALVELTFKPVKAGNFTVALRENLGKEKTKMVDDKSQILYPAINELALDIY